ncbi:hypothetical protein Tco_1511042, partial [Tanacetum coccineum]
LCQASPKPVEEGATSSPKATRGTVARETHPVNLEKEVVVLSENTRPPTLLVIFVTQPSSHVRTGPSPDVVTFSDGNYAEHQFIPEWGLRDDMSISSVRACKEMITHLATPAEGDFLGGLSYKDLVRCAYQCLGKCVLSQGKFLKRHERLNSEHVDLRNRSDVQLEELKTAYSSCPDRENELIDQLIEVEKERDDWRLIASGQVEKIKALEGEIEPKSWLLAEATGQLKELGHEGYKTWKDKHRELFTKQYLFIQKVVDSYRLPMEALLQFSPDLPSAEASTGPSTGVNNEAAATQAPSRTE